MRSPTTISCAPRPNRSIGLARRPGRWARSSSCCSERASTDERRPGCGACVEADLEARQITAEEAVRSEHQRQGMTQVSVANAITSLRLCSEIDWREFVEGVSLVEQALRRDPAGVYGRMDFLSRDEQRHAIEQVAAPERGSAGARRAAGDRERAPGGRTRIGGRPRGARRLSPRRPRPSRTRSGCRLSTAARDARAAARARASDAAVSWLDRGRHDARSWRSPSGPSAWRESLAGARGRARAPGSARARSRHRVRAAARRRGASDRAGCRGSISPTACPENARTMVVVPTLLASPDGVAVVARTPRGARAGQPGSAASISRF